MRIRLLSRPRGILFPALLLALALPAAAQKKPLDHDSYDIWNRIAGQAIADDGRWVLYGVVSEKYDPTLIVRSTQGSTEHRLERGEAGQFSDDGRFVVFRIKPSKEAVKEAKKAKKKPDEMPQDSLGILDLSNGQIVRVEMDHKSIGDNRPVRAGPPARLHRALDATLDLHGLHVRTKEPCRRALEEAFEEPLDGGQGRHGRWQSSRGLAGWDSAAVSEADHPLRPAVPPFEGT